MTRLFCRSLACAAIATHLTLAGTGSATATGSEASEQLRQAFAETYGTRFQTSKLSFYLNALFNRFDFDQNGIDSHEIDLVERAQTAAVKARKIGELLRYDLDGDLVITDQEIRETIQTMSRGPASLYSNRTRPTLNQRLYKRTRERLMKADANKDGKIDLKEAENLDNKRSSFRSRNNNVGLARAFLKLDPNGDGRITQIEVFALVSKAFAP